MELCRVIGFNPGLGTFEITLSNIEWDSHVPGLDGSLMGASPVPGVQCLDLPTSICLATFSRWEIHEK